MSGMQPTEPSNAEPTAARTRRAKSQSSQADERDLQRQRVAVVIPAKDEARRIAQTVRAAKAIPHVDLVLVVDDGSEDNTQDVARDAGAVVVRHSHNRGKAAAMETGAAVVAMRDAPGRLPRLLLFIDGDLAETAVNTAPLIDPVLTGNADLAIALLPTAGCRRARLRGRCRTQSHQFPDRVGPHPTSVRYALPDPRSIRSSHPTRSRLGC